MSDWRSSIFPFSWDHQLKCSRWLSANNHHPVDCTPTAKKNKTAPAAFQTHHHYRICAINLTTARYAINIFQLSVISTYFAAMLIHSHKQPRSLVSQNTDSGDWSGGHTLLTRHDKPHYSQSIALVDGIELLSKGDFFDRSVRLHDGVTGCNAHGPTLMCYWCRWSQASWECKLTFHKTRSF